MLQFLQLWPLPPAPRYCNRDNRARLEIPQTSCRHSCNMPELQHRQEIRTFTRRTRAHINLSIRDQAVNGVSRTDGIVGALYCLLFTGSVLIGRDHRVPLRQIAWQFPQPAAKIGLYQFKDRACAGHEFRRLSLVAFLRLLKPSTTNAQLTDTCWPRFSEPLSTRPATISSAFMGRKTG